MRARNFYFGRELYYNKMYRQAIAVLEDFLKDDGWYVNRIEACIDLFYAYLSAGDKKSALNSLLFSFTIAPPNSRICCILGEYFLEKAIYFIRNIGIIPLLKLKTIQRTAVL